MREIKILTLSLRNFKGCETLTLDFGGQSASIYGDNATGKTTIYDALTWLLFGKEMCIRDSTMAIHTICLRPILIDGR